MIPILLVLRSKIASQISQRLRFRSRFFCKSRAMASGLSVESPLNFAQTPEGDLFMANGIDAMRRWNGFTAQTSTVGVPAPEDALTIAVSGIGTISGTYNAYQRFIDEDGNPSNLSPISNSIVAVNNRKITYTNVPVPTANKIARRQIVRNTAGQQAVYYVDVDTEDLGNDTFESTLTDDDLEAQDSVALFDPGTGTAISDRYGLPPAGCPYIAHSNDRMFAAGSVTYRTGHAVLTNGSTTVTGIATAWPASFVNRRFTVAGATEAYEVLAVDVNAQTLTIDRPYAGTSANFGIYAIGPFPAERRLLYYSEAGLTQAWSASNAIPLTEDNDEITGLLDLNGFLYVIEKFHIYRFTFQEDPAKDGTAFSSANRGCVNQRCAVVLDGTAYMLDRRGVYAFATDESVQPISDAIQDLFRPDTDTTKINWASEQWFHGSVYPGQDVIRWFVTLSGETTPRHALCYNYRAQRWWIEEYPFPIGASEVVRMTTQRTLIGGDSTNVLAMEDGTLDGTDGTAGTSRGTVTTASLCSIIDSNASFPTSGIVGYQVAIVDGKGKGQTRRIVKRVSATELEVNYPWFEGIDTTSVYQVGAINWLWRSGWFRYVDEEHETGRGFEFMFEPLDAASGATMDVRTLKDYNLTPINAGITRNQQDGIRYTQGNPDAVIDLTRSTGHAMVDQQGRQQHSTRAPGLVALEMRGFTSTDSPVIHQVNVDGVESTVQ